MPQKIKDEITRDCILDKAEALFSQKGYHAVSIREITNAADCNLAAVNYHFNNKQNLYLEVFRARWLPRAGRIIDFFKNFLMHQKSHSAAVVVQALAQAFLAGPLSDEERQRHHQLITRELCQPTEAFEILAEEVIRPFFKDLFTQIRASMPEEMEQEQLTLSILSIFGMILYFNFAREAVTRITGREYNAAFKNRLINHITNFSLHGLGMNEGERKK